MSCTHASRTTTRRQCAVRPPVSKPGQCSCNLGLLFGDLTGERSLVGRCPASLVARIAGAHSSMETNRMLQRPFPGPFKSATSAVSIALLGVALSGCVSGEEQRYRDTNTCQSFGAPYGSRAYTNCMLEQQRRSDNRQRESLEQVRLTQEIARNAQVMTDRARWDRCRRDPDRRECRR